MVIKLSGVQFSLDAAKLNCAIFFVLEVAAALNAAKISSSIVM